VGGIAGVVVMFNWVPPMTKMPLPLSPSHEGRGNHFSLLARRSGGEGTVILEAVEISLACLAGQVQRGGDGALAPQAVVRLDGLLGGQSDQLDAGVA
jgi:hypothetical protein